MTRMLVNIFLFQIGWFACVLSGSTQHPWIEALIAIAIVGIHVLLAPVAEAEFKLVLIAIGIGAAWDSMLVWLPKHGKREPPEHLSPL